MIDGTMKFKRNSKEADRLAKLARNIEALVEKDERLSREARDIAGLRQTAALELHSMCSAFVGSVNKLLSKAMLEFVPPEYSADAFRDPGVNVFQINASGRIVHIEFQATDTSSSTERYPTPYILHGAVRCFNQDMLDRAVIPEWQLFYCVEDRKRNWLLYDPRSHRASPFDKEHLITLMEQLIEV